jgi:hypothetical protein
MTPFAPNERLALSDARGTVLGTVAVEDVCGDAILGAFVPGPGFAAFVELFRRFDEHVEAGALAVLPGIESEIAALGLCVARAGEAPVPADVVQIYSDGGFSCRPRVPVTLNGSTKCATVEAVQPVL